MLPNSVIYCEIEHRIFSNDGRYFNIDTQWFGEDETSAEFEVFDRDMLPMLELDTPLTVEFGSAKSLFFRYEVQPGVDYVLTARSAASPSRSGYIEQINGNLISGHSSNFTSTKSATLHEVFSDETTRVIRIVSSGGLGDVELELTSTGLPFINDGDSLPFDIAARDNFQALVAGTQNELARFIATVPNNIVMSIQNAAGTTVNVESSSADSGLVRFPSTEVYTVRLLNSASARDAVGDLSYTAMSLPETTVPMPAQYYARELEPGEVHVYQLPYVELAAIHAQVYGVNGGDAPLLSFELASRPEFGSALTYFPMQSLIARQKRRPNGSEAYTNEVLPTLQHEHNQQIVTVYVSAPDHDEPLEYELDLHLVNSSLGLLVGECEGADTPSLIAASSALQNGGTIELCSGEHRVNEGLNIYVPVVTIKGAGSQPGGSLVSTWDDYGITIALSNGVIPDKRGSDVTIQDLSILTVSSGLQLNTELAQLSSLSISTYEPLGHYADGQLSACIHLGRALLSTEDHLATVDDLYCSGSERGVRATNIDELYIADSFFEELSMQGVDTTGGQAIVRDSTFIEVQYPINLGASEAGSSAIGNIIEARTLPNPGAPDGNHLIVLQTIATDDPDAPISQVTDNNVDLLGETVPGIWLFARAGTTIEVERNFIRGGGQHKQYGVEFSAGNESADYGAIIIRNNILSMMGDVPIFGRNAGNYEQVSIINNTVLVPKVDSLYKALIYITKGQYSSHLDHLDIRNNIFVSTSEEDIRGVAFSDGLDLNADYNLFYGLDEAYQSFSGSTDNPPLSASANDLFEVMPGFDNSGLMTLLPSSPAVGSGAYGPGIPEDDFSGNPRPQGLGVDRGAHQRQP